MPNQALTNEVFSNEMRRLGKQVELLTKVITVAHATKVDHPSRELLRHSVRYILEEAYRLKE